MIRIIFMISILLLSSLTCAEQLSTVGNITNVWTYTDKNPTSGASNVLAFRLNNPLSGGCGYVWVGPNNKVFLAQVALAQATNKAVTLYYDNTIAAPWGDSAVCAAFSIDILIQ
jgi:hypothetical protein